MPGSGWCHHPQRKVSSDVKILVRRSELACRDDWSRHLWQPTNGEPAPELGPLHGQAVGPLRPVSQESLRGVLNRDLSPPAAPEEDVLLSEGRIVSESEEGWQAQARPFPAGRFDPRTAIFKAREAYREKLRANAVATRQAVVETGAGAFERAELSPLREQQQAIERRFGVAAPRAEGHEPRQPDSHPLAATDSAVHPGLVPTPPVLHDDQSTEVESSFWEFLSAEIEDAPPAQNGDHHEVCLPEQAAPDERRSLAVNGERALLPAALPAWFRNDLPRVCRTCRDFRPGTDGQRGWCANSWAFTHRQLVREDDPAPCHSAIGDWWAPVDDVWLVAADVSSHGRPTPLLDRLAGGEAGQRRRS